MGVHGLTAKGVPPTAPQFLLYLKIAIIVISVIILALAAYSISLFGGYYGYYGYSGVGGLLIFAVIKTWIIYGVFLFLEMKAQHLFYRLIALIAYIISVIFWLSAWAWSASVASLYLSLYTGYPYNNYYSAGKSEGAALAACAGLGALLWVLSIVHLVFFIRACLSDDTAAGTHNQAELGQVHGQPKQEATTTVYPTGAPAPVQYQQSPYQQPQPAYQQPQPYATQ